jgi:hypothetical protein
VTTRRTMAASVGGTRRNQALRHVRFVFLGSVVLVLSLGLAACGATASLAPGAGSDATAPLTSATSGAASVAAPASTATTLADTPTDKMCTLLSADEAKAFLGKDLSEAPNGVNFKGLGTNCIYQDDATMAPGTFIKVEINPVSYQTNVGLLTLGGGTISTFTAAGLEATAVDVGGIHTDAGLVVKLSDGTTGPSMLIQAPTLAMAKAVAEKVIPRLAGLR